MPWLIIFNVLITVMFIFIYIWYIDTVNISVYVKQWIDCACYLLSKIFPYIYKVVVKTICNLVFIYSYFTIYIKIFMIIIVCVHGFLLRLK